MAQKMPPWICLLPCLTVTPAGSKPWEQRAWGSPQNLFLPLGLAGPPLHGRHHVSVSFLSKCAAVMSSSSDGVFPDHALDGGDYGSVLRDFTPGPSLKEQPLSGTKAYWQNQAATFDMVPAIYSPLAQANRVAKPGISGVGKQMPPIGQHRRFLGSGEEV